MNRSIRVSWKVRWLCCVLAGVAAVVCSTRRRRMGHRPAAGCQDVQRQFHVLPHRVQFVVRRLRRRLGRRLSARRREPVDPPLGALRSRRQLRPSGTPNYVVIQATEPELFKCPFVAVTNHGRGVFTPEEVAALRAYLQKGGFLWADDAWGSRAWDHWLAEMRKILPASDTRSWICRSTMRSFTHFRRAAHPADPEHRLLPRLGRTNVRTMGRQRHTARVRAARFARPDRDVDDPQHRFRRRV